MSDEVFLDALRKLFGDTRGPIVLWEQVDLEVWEQLWHLSQAPHPDLGAMIALWQTSYDSSPDYCHKQWAQCHYLMTLLQPHEGRVLRDHPEFFFGTFWVDAWSDEARSHATRRYAKDRRWGAAAAQLPKPAEVALPLGRKAPWDTTGWMHGREKGRRIEHRTGSRRQREVGVPVLETIRDVRTLCEVRSLGQFRFLVTSKNQVADGLYETFTIPKRSGGHREIASPSRQLRHVQQRLLREVLAPLPTHDAAHAYVPGRSIQTNALPHLGKALLLKFDLHNFFPSIEYPRVIGLFASMGYPVGNGRYSANDEDDQVAPTLARLCCFAKNLPTSRMHLPQGAPTSPAISNLICRTLDSRLAALADKVGADYTRYADDLTFSFHEEPSQGIGRFRWWVNQICHQEGFLVREDKFRVVRASQQQRVTGLVVNDKLSIPRRERKRFRAIVYNCERYGVASQARGHPRFEAYLLGYAAYIRMVHPELGEDLLTRVRALLES